MKINLAATSPARDAEVAPSCAALRSRFCSIFDRAMVGIALTRADGSILEANGKLCEMLGYTIGELKRLTIGLLAHPEDRDQHEQLTAELVAGTRSSVSDQQRLVRKTGEAFWVSRMASRAEEKTGPECLLVEVAHDITATIELQQRLRETFDHASVGIMHSSLDRRILMVNGKLCEMVGYSADELQQGSVRRIHYPEDTDADQPLEKRLLAGEIDSFSFEKRYVRKDGSIFWAHRTVSLARDEAGKPKYFIRVIEDISARKQAQQELFQLAHYDTLTGLPNRALFGDRLKQALAHARRTQAVVALLYLDLDQFKAINDSLGHPMGDLLLKQVAHRLNACVRNNDTVGRLSGDEFAIILGEAQNESGARIVADKILQSFCRPFRLENHECSVTTSIGISLYPVHGHEEDALIKAADRAMYRAKEAGRNRIHLWTGQAYKQDLS